MSFVRKYQQRVANKAQTSSPDNILVVGGSASHFLKLLDTQLETDLIALKGIKNIELKESEKRDRLVPAYTPHVERLIAEKQQHPVLGYFLVWLFDAGMIEEAMAHAEFCMNNDVALPERFKSDTTTFIYDSLGKWAEAEVAADHSPEPYLSNLLANCEALAEQGTPLNIPGKSIARLYKVRGLVAEKDGRLQDAVDDLERAFALGENCKTVLNNCKKKLLKADVAEYQKNVSETPEQAEA